MCPRHSLHRQLKQIILRPGTVPSRLLPIMIGPPTAGSGSRRGCRFYLGRRGFNPRYVQARQIPEVTATPSGSAGTWHMAVFARIEPALRKSITFDNDTAFAQHALLRTMRAMTTWFCDAYASRRAFQPRPKNNSKGRKIRTVPSGKSVQPTSEVYGKPVHWVAPPLYGKVLPRAKLAVSALDNEFGTAASRRISGLRAASRWRESAKLVRSSFERCLGRRGSQRGPIRSFGMGASSNTQTLRCRWCSTDTERLSNEMDRLNDSAKMKSPGCSSDHRSKRSSAVAGNP